MVALATGEKAQDDSTTVRLLGDIREVYGRRKATRLSSAVLVADLATIEESPWGEWNRGRPLTPHALAALLRRHGIRPGTVRLDDFQTAKGYKVEDFEDAWSRYLEASRNGSLLPRKAAAAAGCDGVTAFSGVRTGESR